MGKAGSPQNRQSGRSVRVAHLDLRQWLSAPARHSTFNEDGLRCTVVPSTPAAQKHRMTGRRHHNRLESARHSARSLLASAPPAAFRLSRTRCPFARSCATLAANLERSSNSDALHSPPANHPSGLRCRGAPVHLAPSIGPPALGAQPASGSSGQRNIRGPCLAA